MIPRFSASWQIAQNDRKFFKEVRGNVEKVNIINLNGKRWFITSLLTERFLACPFASLGASAQNDSALMFNGVRRGLRPGVFKIYNHVKIHTKYMIKKVQYFQNQESY